MLDCLQPRPAQWHVFGLLLRRPLRKCGGLTGHGWTLTKANFFLYPKVSKLTWNLAPFRFLILEMAMRRRSAPVTLFNRRPPSPTCHCKHRAIFVGGLKESRQIRTEICESWQCASSFDVFTVIEVSSVPLWLEFRDNLRVRSEGALCWGKTTTFW